MSKFALFVIGSAGTGKTTFAATLLEYFSSHKKTAHYVNLDPASVQSSVTELGYAPVIDIKEIFPADYIMKTFDLGPNGALLKCLDSLVAERDYIEKSLCGFEKEFLIVDCPGQIEIFMHGTAILDIISIFQENDYSIGAAYVLDAVFLHGGEYKLLSGLLSSIAAMMNLNIPHVNIVSKMDLCGGIDAFDPDFIEKALEVNPYVADQCDQDEIELCNIIKDLLSNYGAGELIPLDITDRDSIATVAEYINCVLQNDEMDLSGKDYDDVLQEC